MYAVECKNVSKWFRVSGNHNPEHSSRSLLRTIIGRKERFVAVDNISFRVDQGDIFGIIGPNGSGKSTLIRMMATLLEPDAGVIRVFGKNIRDHQRDVRRLINRVSVEASFFKKLSPMENLLYAARLYGVNGDEIRMKSVSILEHLGLDRKKIFNSMEDLSRGQQQKVAIVRALLSSPKLLLLDEPTTGLDPKSKTEVQNFVLSENRTRKITVILTTHDMYEADRLCHKIALIDDGKFLMLDTPGNLKKRFSSNGEKTTLEEVFLQLAGKKLEV